MIDFRLLRIALTDATMGTLAGCPTCPTTSTAADPVVRQRHEGQLRAHLGAAPEQGARGKVVDALDGMRASIN